jgi:hypothetical protein
MLKHRLTVIFHNLHHQSKSRSLILYTKYWCRNGSSCLNMMEWYNKQRQSVDSWEASRLSYDIHLTAHKAIRRATTFHGLSVWKSVLETDPWEAMNFHVSYHSIINYEKFTPILWKHESNELINFILSWSVSWKPEQRGIIMLGLCSDERSISWEFLNESQGHNKKIQLDDLL